MHLEGFQVASAKSGDQLVTDLTIMEDRSDWSGVFSTYSHRSNWCWIPVWPIIAKLVRCSISWQVLHALVQGGVCICLEGDCTCWRDVLLCRLSLFLLWVCSFVVSLFCLSCVEPLPLPKGTETFLLQVILFSPLIDFRSLVWVFYSIPFFFLFLLWQWLCVLSMHSSMGRMRTCVWPRTGGWSLLSDEWLTTWCGLTLGLVLHV
jgi:hypothetical protein